MDSGVATRPLESIAAYKRMLSRYVWQTSGVMEPVFASARERPKTIVYAEGEDERVLDAAQQVVDLGLAEPVLIGRPDVIEARMKEQGLRIRDGAGVRIVHPGSSERLAEYTEAYYRMMGRKGVSRARATHLVGSRSSIYASLMLQAGEVDGMICGAVGPFSMHLQRVRDVIGKAPGVRELSTLVVLILRKGTYFVCDTHVTLQPSAEELAEMTLLSAGEVRRFGIEPKVALLSHSNFGAADNVHAQRVRDAVAMIKERAPDLMVDGEMHGEAAISVKIRNKTFDGSALKGEANLLVMPNRDAAHISYTLLKMLGGGGSVGPILVGAAKPVNVVTQSISVRGLINMTAHTVVQAQVVDR